MTVTFNSAESMVPWSSYTEDSDDSFHGRRSSQMENNRGIRKYFPFAMILLLMSILIGLCVMFFNTRGDIQQLSQEIEKREEAVAADLELLEEEESESPEIDPSFFRDPNDVEFPEEKDDVPKREEPKEESPEIKALKEEKQRFEDRASWLIFMIGTLGGIIFALSAYSESPMIKSICGVHGDLFQLVTGALLLGFGKTSCCEMLWCGKWTKEHQTAFDKVQSTCTFIVWEFQFCVKVRQGVKQVKVSTTNFWWNVYDLLVLIIKHYTNFVLLAWHCGGGFFAGNSIIKKGTKGAAMKKWAMNFSLPFSFVSGSFKYLVQQCI